MAESGSGYGEPFSVELTAHRVGNFFGTPVSESVKDEGDPEKYIILVNDDYDDDLSDTGPDNSDNVAAISFDDTDPIDDDLAKITLRTHGVKASGGTVRLLMSNGASAKFFKEDGTLLSDFQVSIASPSGDLAPLINDGEMDIWLEGMQKDSDFVLSIIYEDESASEVNRDEIHILIVEFSMRDHEGNATPFVELWFKDLVINEADGVDTAPSVPDAAKFKIRVDGLPTSVVNHVFVTSDENESDYFEDSFATSSTMTESEDFAVIYASTGPDDVLTDDERTRIKDELELNAVHNQKPKADIVTADDSLKRDLEGLYIDALQQRSLLPDKPKVNKLIYDSDSNIEFSLAKIGNLPRGTKVEWDFNGVEDDHPAEEGDAPGDRVVKYSRANDGAGNIKLEETPANYRKTYTVSAKVTFPDEDPKTISRTIRVALAKRKIHTDADKKFPAGVPNDVDFTNNWLKTTYADFPANSITNGLPFSDFDAINDAGLLGTFDAVMAPNSNRALVQQNRIALGTDRDLSAMGLGGSGALTLTHIDDESRDGDKFTTSYTFGTLVLPAKKGDAAFTWDKPELDYMVEHERNHLREMKKIVEGTSLPGQIRAAFLRLGFTGEEIAFKGFRLWMQYVRMSEDFTRAASAGANGDVSWNFMINMMHTYWLFHSSIIAGTKDVFGNLAMIDRASRVDDRFVEVYQAAYNYVVNVYKTIPVGWADMKAIQQKAHYKGDPIEPDRVYYLRFHSPEEEQMRLRNPNQ